MFEEIVNETREKFEIGETSQKLLSILLAMIEDKENGGFAGFLETFNRAGLGSLAASWVNSGANMTLSNEQTESVFGEGTLHEMAAELGIEYEKTVSATAFLTPHIVDRLTPNSEVPDENEFRSLLGKNQPLTKKAALPDVQTPNADDNMYLRIVLPIIVLGILLAIAFSFCS